jgi:hypothetical protein
MTWRAVLAGLVAGAFVCAFGYFNDAVMRQTMFVGSNMPISVYGGLILFVFLLNPLLKRWAFSAGELAVALALVLAMCCIPGSGLMRTFTGTLMMPWQWERSTPGWRAEGIVETAPRQMLASPGNQEDALNGFVRGIGNGRGLPNLREVPWQAWRATLAFWIPLILLLWIGLIGLALVVHRQWSEHEHLRYPLATFSNALLPEAGKRWGAVLGDRLFWIGAGLVFLIHFNNYLAVWFPEFLVTVPTKVDFSSLVSLFPTYAAGDGGLYLQPTLYFTVLAFGYFLASDVSLAMGLGPFLYPLLVGALAGYGLSLTAGGMFAPNAQSFMNLGAYFGLLLAILYTGRHYYGRTLRRAIMIPTAEAPAPEATWGARLFLICAILFTLNLISVGLDWPLAVLYTGMIFMLFIVIGRLIAETGAFMIQPYWFPCVTLWGIFGARALGARPVLIMLLLSAVLAVDPREALMPFMVNAFKLLDLQRERIGRAAAWSVAAILIGLAVAVPVTLAFQYDRGVNHDDEWAAAEVPQMPFDKAIEVRQRLTTQGTLESAEAMTGWRRFAEMSPKAPCLIGFGASLAMVLAFAAIRLRWPKWPLHPVLFLVWSTWPGRMLAASFLGGWGIKVLVTQYGGASWYQRLKPLMFGLIAGEMLGGLVPMAVGLVYWLATGLPPKSFNILPN